MGSILSAIRDDEDDYYSLCRKYNETPREVYSIHYRWIVDKHDGKTDKSYSEFEREYKKNSLKKEIEYKKEDIRQLQKKLKEL